MITVQNPSGRSRFENRSRVLIVINIHTWIVVMASFLFLTGAITPLQVAAAEEEQPQKQEVPEGAASEMDGQAEVPPNEEVPHEVSSEGDGKTEVPQQEGVQEETTSEMDEQSEVAPQERGFIDETQAALSNQVMRTAAWIDSFFDAERVQAEENESTLRLKLKTFIEEGETAEFGFNASLRLVLPKLQDRVSLVVSGDPDDDPDFEKNPADARQAEVTGSDERNVTVSFQYKVKETLSRYISASMGFRFRGLLPVVYLEGRYRYQVPLDHWTARFTQRFRWYTDVGWESRTNLTFDTTLSPWWFFRTGMTGDWYEDRKDEGFFYGIGAFVTQKLSERRAIEYGWVNSFQTEPNNHLEEITFAARYRQNIWRSWVFYEIQPQIRFPKSEAFNITPGVLLLLESIIGKPKG